MTLTPEHRRALRRIRTRRDTVRTDEAAAVRAAAAAGGSLREIAAEVGLSHMQVKRLLTRESGPKAPTPE